MDASYSYSNIPYSLDIPIHLQKTPLTNYTNENNAYERIQNFYFSESKQFVKNENSIILKKYTCVRSCSIMNDWTFISNIILMFAQLIGLKKTKTNFVVKY